MKNIAIIDAGPIVALFNFRDRYHKQILNFLKNYNGKLITTWQVNPMNFTKQIKK